MYEGASSSLIHRRSRDNAHVIHPRFQKQLGISRVDPIQRLKWMACGKCTVLMLKRDDFGKGLIISMGSTISNQPNMIDFRRERKCVFKLRVIVGRQRTDDVL